MSGCFREVERVIEVTNPGEVTEPQGTLRYSCRSNSWSVVKSNCAKNNKNKNKSNGAEPNPLGFFLDSCCGGIPSFLCLARSPNTINVRRVNVLSFPMVISAQWCIKSPLP